MASPTRISVVALSGNGPYTGISVPTDAIGVVAMWGEYGAFSTGMTALASSFATFSTANRQQSPSVGGVANGAGVWWADITSTGTGKTLTPTWGGTPIQGPLMTLFFYKDITAGAWVRAMVSAISGATFPLSLASNTDDDVLVLDSQDSAAPAALTGFTTLNTRVEAFTGGRFQEANSPGASTTSIPTNSANPATAAISIIGAAGGGGITGTLAATEGGSDTVASSGTVLVQGALTSTELAGDTAALAGAVLVAGTLTVIESGSDTAVITGGSVATGALNAVETGGDAAALAGTVLVEGDLSVSETGSDTASIAGAVLISGSLAAAESGSDSAAMSGFVLVQGSIAAAESGEDVFVASGSLSDGINGSLNATESGSDTFASSGLVVVSGALSASEAGADSAVISGAVLVQGALTVSETGPDVFAAEGSASIRTGTLNAAEEGSDTAQILGEGVAPVVGSPHGFVITDTAPKLWWQRKPKALDEQEAEEKVAKVVRVVERIARQQVEANQPAPAKDQKREVREAIAPLVAEMPGFDWMTLYRTILIELGRRAQEQQAAEQAQMEIARIQAMRRDEDDVLLLLMSI